MAIKNKKEDRDEWVIELSRKTNESQGKKEITRASNVS